jgi:hypothetical protein
MGSRGVVLVASRYEEDPIYVPSQTPVSVSAGEKVEMMLNSVVLDWCLVRRMEGGALLVVIFPYAQAMELHLSGTESWLIKS